MTMTSEELVQNILDDPLTQQFLRLSDLRGDFTRAAEVIGQKRWFAFAMLTDKVDFVDAMGIPYSLDQNRQFLAATVKTILKATPILITWEAMPLVEQMKEKVKEAQGVGGQRKLKSLPFDNMWFAMASTVNPPIPAFTGKRHDGCIALEFTPYKNNERLMVKLGTFSPALNDALAIFLEEKVIQIREERPDRQMRKASSRLGFPDEMVRFIDLRPIKYEGPQSSSGGQSEETREYHRQWLVRGHIRNQWYPAKQAHELKWIDPYVKGPEDKPFIETVRRVRR